MQVTFTVPRLLIRWLRSSAASGWHPVEVVEDDPTRRRGSARASGDDVRGKRDALSCWNRSTSAWRRSTGVLPVSYRRVTE
jgi:hypothetical protein